MKYATNFLLFFVTIILFSCTEKSVQKSDPLPSWNDGKTKQSIIDFVTKTTTEGNADFIPVANRIACFDNDGTLWSEQPMYFQFFFAMDRIRQLAPEHPEWKDKQPFKAVLENDMETVMKSGVDGLLTLTLTSHSGVTTDDFRNEVKNWINTARHPKTGKLFKEMVFQPMLELLDYLRANNYKTFIVSGGGIDFMRPWTQEVYGIPPEQVVGSSGKLKYEVVDGIPTIIKLPEINFINDKEGKPVGIYQCIGMRPVFTAGNSDGDDAMLQWTTAGKEPRFEMIIHHTDAEREYAYDRESSIGHLEKGLEDAAKYDWLVVDMMKDWNKIYNK